MNIAELQKQISKPYVTEEQLIQYIQNPDSGPPGVSILALTELERRKRLPTPTQANPMQTSVAAQKVAEARPDMGGVASLAGGGIIGSEEAYASGGIIAFDEGGDVQRYAEGRRVSGSEQYALERARAEKERELAYARLQDAILSRTGTPSSWQYALTGGNLGSPYEPATPGAEAGYKKQLETQADAINRAKYAGTSLESGPLANLLPQTNVTPLAMTPNMPAATETPLPPVDMRVPVEQANLGKGIVEGKFNVPQSRPTAPVASASGLEAPVIPYTPMAEADMTPAGNSRTSMQEYQDLIGADPNAAKAKERLSEMEQANELYKQQYPWLALAEAGFGIASGTSPNAISNIAAGGMKGITALGAGRKESRDQQEKIINAEAKVAEAERAVQLKAAEFGVNDSRTKDAARRLEKAKEADRKLIIDTKNKEFEVDIEKLKVTERNADRRLRQQLASSEKQATSAVQREKIAAMSKSIESATSIYNTALKEYNDLKTGMASEKDLAEAQSNVLNAKRDYDLAKTYASSILGTTGAEYLGVEK